MSLVSTCSEPIDVDKNNVTLSLCSKTTYISAVYISVTSRFNTKSPYAAPGLTGTCVQAGPTFVDDRLVDGTTARVVPAPVVVPAGWGGSEDPRQGSHGCTVVERGSRCESG